MIKLFLLQFVQCMLYKKILFQCFRVFFALFFLELLPLLEIYELEWSKQIYAAYVHFNVNYTNSLFNGTNTKLNVK